MVAIRSSWTGAGSSVAKCPFRSGDDDTEITAALVGHDTAHEVVAGMRGSALGVDVGLQVEDVDLNGRSAARCVMLIGTSRWPNGASTGDEVESLLQDGASWEVYYCWGGHRPPEDGAGIGLPEGVLAGVPTRADRRRIERGKSRRTFFYALVRDDGVLVLTEG